MPDIPDNFSSIRGFNQSQLRVKGSKFIASVFPVENEKEVQDSIQKIKKEFYDATHHCLAYRIKLKDKDIIRTSDAGEPKGTAGEPIFLAIKSKNLYNVLIVVTRYFGGIKLGKGGLSRAYQQVASEALETSEIVERFITTELKLVFPLNMIGKVTQVLNKYGARILEKDFQTEGKLHIEIRASQKENLVKSLIGITAGQVKFGK
ncbi:MAG: IMPACT family protein [candidate division Zixibacteria bacterium]|nr:IMPACT family protein [candidate division Zixibacteria bacterium]